MTNEEAKSCIGTIEMLRRLAYNIHGVMDVIDADNCEKIIKVLSDIPKYKDAYNRGWVDGAKASYEHLKMCAEEQGGDLISRDAVIDTIDKWVKNMGVLIALPANEVTPLFDSIHELPSVNPQEKTGHWVAIDEEPHEDYECDKCGYTISTYTANIEPHTEYKYCPNCGARMESEVQE